MSAVIPRLRLDSDARRAVLKGIAANLLLTQGGAGAVAQTILAKSEESVSVKDFGAVGDGVADDTVPIQRALDTGRNVMVPPGEYRLTASLTLAADHQAIFAHGWSSVLRQTVGTLNVVEANRKAGVAVRGLKLVAAGAKSSLTSGCGVLFAGVTRGEVSRCWVTNHLGAGICLQNSNQNLIEGNRLTDSPATDVMRHTAAGADIAVIYASSANLIRSNWCVSGNAYGVYIQAIKPGDLAEDNLVAGNVVKDCRAYGIITYRVDSAAGASVDRTILVGNTVKNTKGSIADAVRGHTYGAAIYVQGSEEAVVADNTIDGSHTAAVTFLELLAPGAIGATNQSNITITGNVIRNAGMYGIHVGDPSDIGAATGHAVVSGNTVRSVAKEGIRIHRRGRAIVTGNAVDTTTGSGIAIRNTVLRQGIVVSGNTVRNVGGLAGVHVAYADQPKVSGNSVYRARTHGIYVEDSNDVGVVDNSVRDHGQRGIQIASSVTRARVAGNVVRGNGTSVAGITLDAPTRLGENHVSNCVSLFAGSFAPFATLAVNSTSPSVADGSSFVTGNTSATVITNFSGGYHGQEILVVFRDANTTLNFSSSNLKGNGGVDRLMKVDDSIKATYNATLLAWFVTISAAS